MSDVLWTIAAMFVMYFIGGLTGAIVYRSLVARHDDIPRGDK